MTSNAIGRAGVLLHPSLPTIKETTMSWLGSDLESSLFSTNGKADQGNDQPALVANVQRYIDFDDQCLSLKSGEESDFSGIQPLPLGSDDTPPMAVNNFNKVVRMDFASLVSESQNRPKPIIHSDTESVDGDDQVPATKPSQEFVNGATNTSNDGISADDFQELVGMLDGKMIDGTIEDVIASGDSKVMERLQLIRLWQLMQEEELKRRQETELAMLQAQKHRMHSANDCQNFGLEKVVDEEYPEGVEEALPEIETGDLISNAEEDLSEDRNGKKSSDESEVLSHLAQNRIRDHAQEDFDEVPIEQHGKKSFEQLLEEELQKEQELKKQKEAKSKGPVKRPFLRKGQGLARFKGPPVRKPTKAKAGNANAQAKKEVKKAEGVKSKPDNTAKPQTKPQKVSVNQTTISRKARMPIQKLLLKPEISVVGKNGNISEDPKPKSGKEDIDLEEFEMLERYAEDDASFFSEPSLVVSLLQHERETHGALKEEGQMSLRERVRERRRLREEARKSVQKSLNRESDTKVDAPHNEIRNSSTNDIFEVNNGTEEELHDSTIKEGSTQAEALSPEPPAAYFRSPEAQRVKVIQRKTASLVKREKLHRPVAQPASDSPIFSSLKNPLTQTSSNPAFSKLSSSPNSAFSPHHQIISQSIDAKDVGLKKDHEDENDNFEDDQTWGDIDISVLNSSQIRHSDDEGDGEAKKLDGSDKTYKCSDYMEPESEDVENPVRDTDRAELKLGGCNSLSLSPPPPPTVLMQKLFPGLKIPKRSSVMKQDEQEHSSQLTGKDEKQEDTVNRLASEESQTSLLKQKLQELEKEIAKFRKENASLESLRIKQEEALQHLSKEMEEFKKQKEEELARLEEHKKTETKKLKKERKLFEEHVLATKMLPRKEEREEIQKLQEEMDTLKEMHRSKEQRWISANNRMRNQVERLEMENKELTDRVKEIEAMRLKEWNKKKNTKTPSAWQAINNIVESSVFDVENENPDRTKLSSSGESRISESMSSKKKRASGRGTSKQKESEKPSVKSCMKQPSKTNSHPVLSNHNENALKEPYQPPVNNRGAGTLHKDGKVEKTLKDGSKLVEFPNGTQKEISADGQTVKVKFANGDIKQIYADGSIVYFYEENGTTHTTHQDGLQVFEFPNKQVEHHFPDGTKQISFPDQTVKYLHTDGTEQTVFPDGTEMHVASNKDKTIVFANGQREIHTSSFKRREYPDGTSKTVFGDGRQETRYSSGRLRVKDAHGNVIIDRMVTSST